MATTETAPDRVSTRASTLQLARRLASAPTVGPLVALVATMAFFSLKTDRFLQTQNLSLVLQQVMVARVVGRSVEVEGVDAEQAQTALY